MRKRMRTKNKMRAIALTGFLVLAGCRSAPTSSAGGSQAAATTQGKVYSLEDVNRELRDAGVQTGSTREVAREFFRTHPAYTVCKDFDGGMIAVVRNRKLDPKADDQYIVVNYRDGKLDYLDIGPPEFSVGNVASYCQ